MRQIAIICSILFYVVLDLNGQSALVDRSASAIGVSYSRQSNSNRLGAMYSRSFDGVFAAAS